MSRELLVRAGYDPDEEIIFTPDILCGTGILNFYVEYGVLPTEERDIERIANIANYDLERAGLPADADSQSVQNALKIVKKSRITEL